MMTAMLLRTLLAGLSLFIVVSAWAEKLSPLAPPPDWTQLEAFQETISHDDFVHLLNTVYAPNDAAKGMVDVQADGAVIKTQLAPPKEFRLRFAKDAAT